MTWAAAFASGVVEISKVPKLDPPAASALKNVQAFVQAVDNAEKMGPELKSQLEAMRKAVAEYNKTVETWQHTKKDIDANMKNYWTSVEKYEKQGREWPQKEYMTGCIHMKKGLELVEGKVNEIDKYYGPAKLSEG